MRTERPLFRDFKESFNEDSFQFIPTLELQQQSQQLLIVPGFGSPISMASGAVQSHIFGHGNSAQTLRTYHSFTPMILLIG